MPITNNLKNIFYNQSRITIVIAFLSILTTSMTIQPPQESDAQLFDLDKILENPLAASGFDLDILNGANVCSNSIDVIETSLSDLLGEHASNTVCLIDNVIR
ncbi:MAG: hypothetical protein AB7V56_08935 [Candidatus Nitrosocosmicus sp.]